MAIEVSRSPSLKYPAGTIIQDMDHPHELGLIIGTDTGTFRDAYRVYALARRLKNKHLFQDPMKSNGCKVFWCHKDYVENSCNVLSTVKER